MFKNFLEVFGTSDDNHSENFGDILKKSRGTDYFQITLNLNSISPSSKKKIDRPLRAHPSFLFAGGLHSSMEIWVVFPKLDNLMDTDFELPNRALTPRRNEEA